MKHFTISGKLWGQFRIVFLEYKQHFLIEEYDDHTHKWVVHTMPDFKTVFSAEQAKRGWTDLPLIDMVKCTIISYIRDIRYILAKNNRIANSSKSEWYP